MFTHDDILRRLCQIEVKGKDNLENLLWCILAVEAIIEAEKNNEADSSEQMASEEKAEGKDG